MSIFFQCTFGLQILNYQTHITAICAGKLKPIIHIEEAERIDILKRSGFYNELELGGNGLFICENHQTALGKTIIENHVDTHATCYWPNHKGGRRNRG